MFSKLKKKNKDFKKEIDYLILSHQQCYKSNFDYNDQSDFYYKNVISNHYNKIKFQGTFQKVGFNDATPLFIIGLPRSGSTLIETIISHNAQNIESVGEFHAVNRSIFDQISSVIYSKDFDDKNFELIIDRNSFQNSLIEKYEFIKNNTFIDKSLENFFNIDIILEFFPNAKFLHTYRNFNDAIIGIHQKMLPELSWREILKAIRMNGIYTNIFMILSKYPSKIMDVELTNLTNQQGEDLKIITSKINDNYLDFYKNKKLFNKTNSFFK